MKITRLPAKIGAITIPQRVIQDGLRDILRELREKADGLNDSNNNELSNDFLDLLPQNLTDIIDIKSGRNHSCAILDP